MIVTRIKLRLTAKQERQLDHWLRHLTSVWNWAVKKIGNDAADGIYYTSFGLKSLLVRHGARIGVPQDALNGTLDTARLAWQRCFKRLARRPRLKGRRNKLNSIAFAHGTTIRKARLLIPYLGAVRFYEQDIPKGHIGQFRLVKSASGWYACLFIQAEPRAVPATANNQIGVDPGFASLLTLSTGETLEHPRELEAAAERTAKAQRGGNRRLTARYRERIANTRRDRNHKLSRQLVSENLLIAFSADRHSNIARQFGKSVQSSGHHQLRSMLAYKSKCRTDGLGIYIEVNPRNSTRTCSACGALTGPTGWIGLKVRQWDCSACGAHHDRDVNAAMNTLIVGAGLAHETLATAA